MILEHVSFWLGRNNKVKRGIQDICTIIYEPTPRAFAET